MSTITTHNTFDPGVLRRAFDTRDAALLSSLYADDAIVERVDVRNQPSSPARLEGLDAIRADLDDVFGRDMTHAVEMVAVGDQVVGYSVRCAYPDGTRVVCAATAELRNGRIVRELGVQAWDGAA